MFINRFRIKFFRPLTCSMLMISGVLLIGRTSAAATVQKANGKMKGKEDSIKTISRSSVVNNDFYNMKVIDIDGKTVSLSDFEGKVLLMVNTASQCGFTSQYEGLQSLYETYEGQGLLVLGFPSNDFGEQEPGTSAQIKEFCRSKYKVTFPLFQKIKVKGGEKQIPYTWLTSQPATLGEVSWNFEKFLISKKGEAVKKFKSSVEPLSKELKEAIESELKK